jgi:hypothetical protein
MVAEADAAGDVEWYVSVESTINLAHQHATTLPRTELIGRVTGRRTGG